jgi:hypothetical protein
MVSGGPSRRWAGAGVTYDRLVASSTELVALVHLIATGDRVTSMQRIDGDPSLALARLSRGDEVFIPECRAQVYEADTALHAAAFAYDVDVARRLVERGADVRARNRRGAEPLHAATTGVPGSANWSPPRQRAVIAYLVGAGADPNATANGGVTPLHRAVRNRCSAAVDALLRAGADASLANGKGSTAQDLARWTTGRGGAGSPEAKAEQAVIVELLERALR